jgi:hypothetical protein
MSMSSWILGLSFVFCVPNVNADTQADAFQSLIDIKGAKEYRNLIADEVRDWIPAAESARRLLLVKKCSALNREFPRVPATNMVAVFNAAQQWWSGGLVNGLPENEVRKIATGMQEMLVRHSIKAEQIATWNKYLQSPIGKRGLAVSSMQLTLSQLEEWLVDVNTGQYWHWPLAKLRQLSDQVELRNALDAAIEDTVPGSSRYFASLSSIPGDQPIDEVFMNSIEQVLRGGNLENAFFNRLSKSDVEAYSQFQKNEVNVQLLMITNSLMEFLWERAKYAAVPTGRPGIISVDELCSKVAAQQCNAESDLGKVLVKHKAQLNELLNSGYLDRSIAHIIKQIPEAGCP